MLGSSPFVFGLTVTWITPIWLLSLGVAAGLLVLLLAYGVIWLVSRRVAEEIKFAVREGILLPIFYLAVAMSGFAVLGVVLVPTIPYRALIGAVSRITAVGATDHEFVIPPTVVEYKLEDFRPRQLEIANFTAKTDEPSRFRQRFTRRSDRP